MRAKRRARRLWIATLATVGIAGGVYAAEEATAPDDAKLEQTINAQRVGEGRLVGARPISEHQLEAFTPEQMLQLGEKYRTEMKAGFDRVEHLRIQAYRSRDLIRITCVDDKLSQAGTVVKMAEPRAFAMARETEVFSMRAHFLLVQQARERVGELVAEAEQCIGEEITTVASGRIREEETPDSNVIDDPTRPGVPIHVVDRPPEASPYR